MVDLSGQLSSLSGLLERLVESSNHEESRLLPHPFYSVLTERIQPPQKSCRALATDTAATV